MTGRVPSVTSWDLPYRAMRGSDGTGAVYRSGLVPGVEVSFVAVNDIVLPIGTYGLVDSGADRSVLPASWAARLGIDIAEDCVAVTARTAGGQVQNFECNRGIEVVIVGQRLTLRAAFSEGVPWVLLGRDDFFHHFDVSFKHREQQFTLSLPPDVRVKLHHAE